MKKLYFFASIILLSILIAGCSNTNKLDEPGNGDADWAYGFADWDGASYIVQGNNKTDMEKISEDEIGEEVGEVTEYSDDEADRTEDKNPGENFSNVFDEGSKYYEIKNENTDKAIAIENDDGKYIKGLILSEWEDKYD